MKLYTLDNLLLEEQTCFSNDFTGIVLQHKEKQWHKNGNLHRLDGPAILWDDGTKFWFFEGKRHRLDGAAIEWITGNKEYWVNNKMYTEEQHKLLVDIMKLKGLL